MENLENNGANKRGDKSYCELLKLFRNVLDDHLSIVNDYDKLIDINISLYKKIMEIQKTAENEEKISQALEDQQYARLYTRELRKAYALCDAKDK